VDAMTPLRRRVLIVDDEPAVTLVLAEHLRKVDVDLVVDTANSGPDAVIQISQEPVDLLVTDLRMPGMDGLQLMAWVQQNHPRTRTILMTAYGDEQVESAAHRLGACSYLEKPFKARDLVEAVRTALAEPEAPGRGMLRLTESQFEEITRILTGLQLEVGAQRVLLGDITGQLVALVGDSGGFELPPLISLIAGSYATTAAMNRYLQETDVLTLNFHEGQNCDIYSANVNEELFVVLILDKPPQRSRIGAVWLFTRRALRQLRHLVKDAHRAPAGKALDADFGALVSEQLDALLTTSDPTPAASESRTSAALRRAAGPTPTTTPSAADRPQTARPPTTTPTDLAAESAPTYTLEQAQEMGLLSPTWPEEV
jgi:CheY-like chemotaxis protein